MKFSFALYSILLLGSFFIISESFAQETAVDDQFVSSDEYAKIQERLSLLEQNNSDNLEIWLVVGTFTAVAVAFWGNRRAGNQLKKQNDISKQNIEYQGILEIMKIFNNDTNGKRRDLIYELHRNETLYKNKGEITVDGIPFTVASVRGTFDNMGKLVHDGYVNKEQFLSMYCGSVIRMFKVLKPHIEFERKNRSSQHFAMYFEEIFDESKKYWKKHFPDDPEPY